MTREPPDPAMDATIALPAGTAPTIAARAPEPGTRSSLPSYRIAEVLGTGGMGEVVLAHDERIGRDVAVKRMRGAAENPDGVSRFLREARIQARLQHPAIVPVHEIGTDAEGGPFFTMKRVSGTTLAELLRADPPTPLQPLLRAFAEVCLAIDFAHARGVVHRDLKPANIILGEFGEVYVLDWGLARVVGERDATIGASDVDSVDGMTQAGSTLGTPGYMAPEQIKDASAVGPAADVYALGAMLFEILAREPLHVRATTIHILASTVAGVDGSPARRRADSTSPPELDALCVATLALDPERRPTTRAVADGVQRYLDGDRDVARRRTLALDHIRAARAALSSDEIANRADAMREAGRALALDPESRDAAELVTSLMLEPPRVLPAALRGELEASAAASQRRQSRVAVLSFVAVVSFLFAAGWNGIRSWPMWSTLIAFSLVMALAAWRLTRRAPHKNEMIFVAIGNAVLASLFSRAFGSLILAPAVTGIMAVSLTSYPQLIDRARLVVAILVASWLVPVLLERVGVLEPTWSVTGGVIRSMSSLIETGGTDTMVLLVAANITTILVFGLFANALARSRRDAQRALEIQAWHLRQLLPR